MQDDFKLDPEDNPIDVQLADESFEQLTDETITNEIIDEMKLLGLPKPAQVSWPRWMGPRDIKQRHEHIIHLCALGMTNRQIAKELDVNEARLSIIINTPNIKEAIKAKRREYFTDDAKAYIKSLAQKSFEVVDEILVNPGERSNVRLDAAKYILDQTVGKAQQNLKVEGSLIGEMIHKMDEMLKDATPATSTNLLDKPVDPMDNFIDDLIPEDVVIGKRGNSEK